MDIRPMGNVVQPGPGSLPEAESPAAVKLIAAPVEPVGAVQQPTPIPSAGQIAQAVQNINKTMQALSQHLEFSVDEASDRTIVKVVDQQTQEVIRQIPSKEALEIAKALDKVQGLLIRQQA